ncbi:MAG: pro-sigmaK processing inhibitor BofA family protein [Helcococcus sp.]|nr:pro-sigmaK processing inhibitor BofA family protein [Helcococcus sp.]
MGAISLIFGVLAIILLLGILKILAVSTKTLMTLLWNGIAGLILLFVFNLVGGIFGLQVEVNALNSIVAGIFGIPGIIVLLLLK